MASSILVTFFPNIEEIEDLKRQHWDKITEIYKNTEKVENQRNIHNEESHEKRLRLLEEFDTNLPAELQSVEEKMKELMEIEQADKLQEEFDNFKKSCDNIMQKKKNLIIEFTKELDYRDQTYVDSMKQFHKDIKKMIKLMSEQFITLRDKMLTELNLIEEKFNEDRKDILDKQYSNYIKSLLDKFFSILSPKLIAINFIQNPI